MALPAIVAGALRAVSAAARFAGFGARSVGGRAIRTAGKSRGGPKSSMKYGADAGGGGKGGKKRASPPRTDRPDEHDKKLNKLWRWDTQWSLAERMTSLIGSQLPTFIHAISVSTIGGPNADIRRMWFLACAAAFGRYRHRVKGVGEANMEAVWDISGKAVKVSIAYTLSGIAGQLTQSTIVDIAKRTVIGGIPALMLPDFSGSLAAAMVRDFGAGGPGGLVPAGPAPGIEVGVAGGIDLLQIGPDQVTIGDGWPIWLRRQPTGDVGLPEALKIGTGDGGEFRFIAEECDKEYFVVRFRMFNRNPDVYGELPFVEGNKLKLPYGQITPIDVSVSPRKPFGSRENVTLRGTTYITSPRLPDDGRLITTGEKRDIRVQPPRPQADGKSRQNMLVSLITSAIHNPCFAPPGVPCSTIPLGGSAGSRLYPAGSNTALGGTPSMVFPEDADQAVGGSRESDKIPRFTE